MRNLTFRFFLSAIALYSMMAVTTAKAAPVQFNQVVQVVNAKPGKANTGGFAQLRLASDDPIISDGDGDDKTKTTAPPQQDERMITETRSEIVEDDVCDCVEPPVGAGFPYWTLGLAGVPLIFLIPPDNPNGNTPTPTPPSTPETPTPTTPTPTTPTPTPTPTTPTPTTPTPTPPEPVPEPMTILLFGTGLASIGMAARRKFGKKDEEEGTEE